jgi:hypothetical protein
MLIIGIADAGFCSCFSLNDGVIVRETTAHVCLRVSSIRQQNLVNTVFHIRICF